MASYNEIKQLVDRIIAEQDRRKLVPLIEQFTKAVVEETKRLDAQITESQQPHGG